MKIRYGYLCFLLITACTDGSVTPDSPGVSDVGSLDRARKIDDSSMPEQSSVPSTSTVLVPGNNTGIVASPKGISHFEIVSQSSNSNTSAVSTKQVGTTPGLLPECPDKVAPGLVDIIAVPEEKRETIRIVNITPREDPYYYTVTTVDSRIAKILDGSGRSFTKVLVPAGRTYSDPYQVQGVAMGQTNIVHSSPYSTFYLPVGVWKIDGIVDFNALGNGKVCYDPGNPTQPSANVLTTSDCGKKVEGVAADGASRLLMRLKSGVKGEACYRVLSEPPTDQGTLEPSDSDRIETNPIASDHWAVTTYVPPKEFELTDKKSREVVVDFAFTPYNFSTGGYTRTNTLNVKKKITIKRPPVLLVHGIWSQGSAWGDAYKTRQPSGAWHIETVDYPNSTSFGTSNGVVGNAIKELVEASRNDKKLATTKVDVIAHSMGNLVSRIWMESSEFRRDDNFNEGDVRKLVALNSPHWGSPLANMLVNMHQNFPDHGFFKAISWIEFFLGDFHNGAVCSLAENSPDLNAINYVSDVKGEAITGRGGTIGNLHGRLAEFRRFFNDTEEATHINPYVFQAANDGIVSVASQADSLPVARALPDVVHANGMTSQTSAVNSVEAANTTYAHLNSGGVFAMGLPYITTFGDGVPDSVTGRGTTIDTANYVAQCTAGSPMRVAAAATASASTKRPSTITSLGVTVVSPVAGNTYPPGAIVPVQVTVDPALQATNIVLAAHMSTGIQPLEMTGPPFTGSLQIPNDLSGPLELLFLVQDVTVNGVGGAQFNINIVSGEIPAALEAGPKSFYLNIPTTKPELSRTITVQGIYPDGTRRDLSDAVTGTTFTSVNPAIVTVTANGVVNPVASGTSYVVSDNQGIKSYTKVVVDDPVVSEVPVNHTTQVSFTARGFRRDQETGRYVQQIVITNNGSLPLSLPLVLVVNDLPDGVLLANKLGDSQVITPLGSAYVTVDSDEQSFVSPGKTASATLEFLNFQGVPITYTPRVFTARDP